jgi:secreted trypsin-like serine protease
MKIMWPLLFAVLAASPAPAMVGGAAPVDQPAVVTIVGARGNFCSGALIARDVVLTAAHCVAGGTPAEFKLVTYDAARTPTLHDVRRVASHPQFAAAALNAHRASADLALLQLAKPLNAQPLPIATPTLPLAASQSFRVIGIGVTVRGDGATGGIARAATLVATSKPGTLQIRLVDAATANAKPGLGACTGDSGAPVLQQQNGASVVVGLVSWSTGPNNSAGCGGLTGATPLTQYQEWIERTIAAWQR